MNKKGANLISKMQWGKYVFVGIVLFVIAHTWVFFWHQFLVYRYDQLFDEATREGTLVEMPAAFQRAHSIANERRFLTNPYTIGKEALILEAGIRSLIDQYRHDLYRMHNTITQNIQALRTVLEVSEEIFFPERMEITERVKYLETQINAESDVRTESMESLVQTSTAYATKATDDLERTRKQLILRDIDSLKHEITFLDSVYRVNKDTTLSFDEKIFREIYENYFTPERLNLENSQELASSFSTLSHLLDPYRIESQSIRKVAREKRADTVAQEAEKWKDTVPPTAPLLDIFSQIYISLKEQKMYVYEDGDLILSTPITSGRQNFETVRGTFKIYSKQRNKLMKSPFPEEEYELWVDYWMGFYGAYGIHDACNAIDCWRTRFWGPSYIYNGSHGCINTPYNAVKFIYNWAKIGTTVHIE